MLGKNTFDFLTKLKENNHREWYHENKKWYNEAKSDFETFINLVINEISGFDPAIRSLEARDCTFRIFRDIRFSKDKTPYKTNMGAFIAKGGRKSLNPGYYVHVEPGGSFLAGGSYMPPSPVLKAIRQEVYNHVDEFKAIVESDSFKQHYPEMYGEKLVNPPKGFHKDHPDIELLKHKSFTVLKKLPDSLFQSPDIMDEINEAFKALFPLNQFLGRAIEKIKS